MSFPLQQQGGFAGNVNTDNSLGGGPNLNSTGGDNNNPAIKKVNMNPSSIDAMFQGILPNVAQASPANSRQLKGGLNMNTMMGSMSQSGGMVPQSRLSQGMQHPNSLNSNLGEEIKRLQQLHQLSSAPSSAGGMPGANQQLMQGLLAQRNGMSANLGVKNAAHQASMLQSPNSLPALSQRDAALFLMQQQQQQQAALQQQQQQTGALQQQQLVVQQQLAGGTLLSPAAAAQLMAQQQQMLPSPSMLSANKGALASRPGPGAIEPFPEKLHRMLTEVEVTGRAHIISFVDEGRAFAIHKPNQFFKEIVPLYFRQSRLSSFKRQLNLYGFELISNGPSRGAYFHELFQRDKPNLCRRMRRVAVKVAKKQDAEQATTSNSAKEEQTNTPPAEGAAKESDHLA